jgi:hypothetical protein
VAGAASGSRYDAVFALLRRVADGVTSIHHIKFVFSAASLVIRIICRSGLWCIAVIFLGPPLGGVHPPI